MNFWLKYIIMFITEIIIYHYLGKYLGVICLVLIAIKLLSDIGLLRSVKLSKGTFEEGMLYYKDFTMPYKRISEAFTEVAQVHSKFKLEKEFCFVGIYYDCDKVEPSKQRSSIGFFAKKNSSFKEEMEKYVLENGYKIVLLPKANTIYAKWEFPFFLSLHIGIAKFYAELKASIDNAHFRRIVGMKPGDNKCSVELYDTCHSVCFHIPLQDQDSFLVHSSFEAK